MNTKLGLTVTATVILAICLLCSASGSDAEGGYVLTADIDHGTLTDVSTGKEFSSSTFSGEITLKFEPNRGYEFREWVLSGDCTYHEDGSEITFTELNSDVTVSVKLRYYSTSQELINIVDVDELPVAGDKLVNSWSIESVNLDMTKDMWEGMPCTPLIVDNVVYVRAGGMLYGVDINTGSILYSVRSQGAATEFYHYLSYGNGVIFDTCGYKAYDLELNYLYDIPPSLKFVTYHDGYFFGCEESVQGTTTYYTMFKTTLDKDSYLENGVKQNIFTSSDKFRLFAQYGQFGNVQIVGDWFFFLEADRVTGSTGYRAITAFNIKTEEHVTCELTGITGMPWDDGWLTYNNGYFYVTAYVAGLFDGVIEGLKGKHSSIAWVKFDFDKGEFEEPKCQEIKNPAGDTFLGIASGLVIYNGRGYVNVRALGDDTYGGSNDAGSCMIAFDITEDGTPVPVASTPSLMSHGGIVVNIAHEDEGLIYIYMVPYNKQSQAVYVFTDARNADGTWSLKETYDVLSPTRFDWCSQAIRAGPNGELVYYVDSGFLDCYVKTESFEMTIILDHGESAEVRSTTGSSLEAAISKLYRGAVIDGGTVTIGDKTYVCYGFNAPSVETCNWEPVSNLSVSKYTGTDLSAIIEGRYKYAILLESGAEDHFSTWRDANKWYYFDGTDYVKCILQDTGSMDAVSGKSLIYSDTKPEVDPTDIWTDRPASITVNRGDVLKVALPDGEYAFSYETVSGAVSAEKSGSKLLITGMAEKSDTLTVILNGKSYPISVSVLPKVTVDGDKTVTESVTESQNDDGSTVIKEWSSTVEGSRTEQVSKETVTDRNGDVLTVRTVTTDTDTKGDYTTGGVPVKVEIVTDVTKDGNGRVISNTESETDTTVIEGNGYVSTNVLKVVKDKVTGKTTSSDKLQSEYASSRYTVEKTTDENGNEETTYLVTSKIESTSLSVPMSILSEVKGSLPISLGTSEIVLSSGAVDTLAEIKNGNLTFSVTEPDNVSSKIKYAAEGARLYEVILSCGDTEQHSFGKFTMTVACDTEPQDGKVMKAWRIDDSGKKSYVDVLSAADGKVTFEADHLSYYAVGFEAENSGAGDSENTDNGFILYAGIGLVLVLILLGAAFYLRLKKQKA